MKKTMKIKGMMCAHCEARVKGALESIDGVTAAAVSAKKGTAEVTLASPVADDALTSAVTTAGYEVVSMK